MLLNPATTDVSYVVEIVRPEHRAEIVPSAIKELRTPY